ncbi:MAG TPA: membrane protein insertion efficiency factor YidD [Planctomycetota bacterium]|nr:membrane protein insertion efficiency factor YidD [Planctomycetota bacterium]
MKTQPCTEDGAKRVSLARRIGMFPIRVYQATLAWALGGHCRFTPSCSHYALEAIEKHGFFKGWWLACWRLLRCQPFCKGGYDPVPPAGSGRRDAGGTESVPVKGRGAED